MLEVYLYTFYFFKCDEDFRKSLNRSGYVGYYYNHSHFQEVTNNNCYLGCFRINGDTEKDIIEKVRFVTEILDNIIKWEDQINQSDQLRHINSNEIATSQMNEIEIIDEISDITVLKNLYITQNKNLIRLQNYAETLGSSQNFNLKVDEKISFFENKINELTTIIQKRQITIRDHQYHVNIVVAIFSFIAGILVTVFFSNNIQLLGNSIYQIITNVSFTQICSIILFHI
jgi:hypothetical protein